MIAKISPSRILPLAGLIVLSTGCSHTVSTKTNTAPQVRSAGLTAQQVDERIRTVQTDPKIPDSVKPSIIAGIRSQASTQR